LLSILLSLAVIFYYIRFLIYLYMTTDNENAFGTEHFFEFINNNEIKPTYQFTTTLSQFILLLITIS
jgi:hypothetical protein